MDPVTALPSPAPHPTAPPPAPAAPPGTDAVPPSGAHRPPATRRAWGRAAGLVAAVGITAYVGATDPSTGGVYPLCPSRALLGLDCPACGGLRGTHDLLRGDLVGALDHNLLLPLWLALYAVVIGAWLLPLAGRPVPRVVPPRWLLASGIVLAGAFTVLRNLPVPGLEFLAST